MAKKLFVHIPKNGGTSLRRKKPPEVVINNYRDAQKLPTGDVRKVLNAVGLKSSFGHIRLCDFSSIKGRHPFCIVRNPWSREVSKYKFLLNSKKNMLPKTQNRRDLIQEFGSNDTITFEEYFRIREKFENVPYTWLHAVENFWPQLDYMTIDGEVKTDVLRFEHYDTDIKAYLKIGKLGKANDMKTGDWKEYYTDQTIQLVADLYPQDIEYFGFDFDTSAQKNYWNE